MTIKYYLQPNPITPDPNDQSARVLPNSVYDEEAIIAKMLKRGTSLTEPDVKAVLSLFFDVASDEVADGNNINLPLVNIRPSISGVFTNASDSFDPSRHIKKASVSAGLLLQKKLSASSVEKILQSSAAPVLLEYQDVNSGTSNSLLTKGGIGIVIGEELKFDPANAIEGIFFIAANGTETRVAVLANRTEGKLVFSVPANLVAGTYSLEVRRAYTSANTIRTGSLNDSLTAS